MVITAMEVVHPHLQSGLNQKQRTLIIIVVVKGQQKNLYHVMVITTTHIQICNHLLYNEIQGLLIVPIIIKPLPALPSPISTILFNSHSKFIYDSSTRRGLILVDGTGVSPDTSNSSTLLA